MGSTAMDRRGKAISVTLIVVTLAVCMMGFYLNREFYTDDAFITLRYARNFINCDGIVWNPGERVEGNTSFLFLMLVSGLGAMGLDLVAASRLVNLFAFFFLLVFVFFCLRHLAHSGRAEQYHILEIAAFAFILGSFPMIMWVLGGLEASMFTLLCTIAIWTFADAMSSGFHGKKLVKGAVAFALACMIRPDGIVFFALSCVFLVIYSWRQLGLLAKRTLLFTLPFLCFFVPYFLWRFNYYGDFFPNTFYAKATGLGLSKIKSGMGYIFFYTMSPPFLFLMLTTTLIYALRKRSLDRRMAYLGCVVLLYIAYVVSVGGDHMKGFRFLLPIIPSAILLLYLSVRPHVAHLNGRRGFALCLITLCLISLQVIWPGLNSWKMDPAAFVGSIIGRYISTAWPKGSLIALNTAGSTPYYAPDNYYIDMLGLNDTHIARRRIENLRLRWQKVPGHSKGDGTYVLSRNPDYIIVGPSHGTTIDDPWFLSDLEMGEDPRFEKMYEVVQVPLDVSQISSHEKFEFSRSGTLLFTYYKRK